jgi:hypothetical protein
MNEEEDYDQFSKQKSTVFDQIKRQTKIQSEEKEEETTGDNVGKIKAKTDSTRLRDFLNNLS